MDTSCPQCQGRQTSKVTAILNTGTVTGSTEGVGVGFGRGLAVVRYQGSTHMQSVLAQQLSPPPKPVVDKYPGSFYWCIFCLICTFIALYFVVGDYLQGSQQNTAATQVRDIVLSVFLWIFLSFWLLGLILGIILTLRSWPRRKTEIQAKLQRWEQAMQRWNTLYYCSTCDSVFLINERDFAPVEEMHRLL